MCDVRSALNLRADSDFIVHARSDVPRLAAELRRAREALRPFAELPIGDDETAPTHLAVRPIRGRFGIRAITVGDIRRARAALEEPSDV
jgi:hypothetical protein